MSRERARAFFDLVSEMRKAQKEYFKTRSSESLTRSHHTKPTIHHREHPSDKTT